MGPYIFPGNQKRYDRIMQLLGDLKKTRKTALMLIGQQKVITERLDTLSLSMMTRGGFDTLDELHFSLWDDIPEYERQNYVFGYMRLERYEDILDNGSAILGVACGIIVALPILNNQKVREIEVAHHTIQKGAWNRGFEEFWRGDPVTGWITMRKAVELMEQHIEEAHYIDEDWDRERFSRSIRTHISTMNTLIDCIDFQDTFEPSICSAIEEQQKEGIKKAIETLYYHRFSIQEQLMQIIEAVDRHFSMYYRLQLKQRFIDQNIPSPEQVTSFMLFANESIDWHVAELDRIQAKNVWNACYHLDKAHEKRTGDPIFGNDDPAMDGGKVREWLANRDLMREEALKGRRVEDVAAEIAGKLQRARVSGRI